MVTRVLDLFRPICLSGLVYGSWLYVLENRVLYLCDSVQSSQRLVDSSTQGRPVVPWSAPAW